MNKKTIVSIVSALAFSATILSSMPLIVSADDNPIPNITSISPSSVIVGSPAFTLTVNGNNFIPGSVVKFNGMSRLTNYVSASQLTAHIPASDVSSTGTFSVTVTNPSPGGGTSNAQQFTVNNAVPIIDNVSPSSVVAGSPAFTLTVIGSNFVPASVAMMNGSARSTVYVSSNQLHVAIPASDVSSTGTFNITVANPGAGGGTSNAVAFSVVSQANNPYPSLTSISPSSAIVGSSALTLNLYGNNFNQNSLVRFNGIAMTTIHISSVQLSALIPASSLALSGSYAVTVTNPAPGGGTSDPLLFTVTRTPGLPNTGIGPEDEGDEGNPINLVLVEVALASLLAISLVITRQILSFKR